MVKLNLNDQKLCEVWKLQSLGSESPFIGAVGLAEVGVCDRAVGIHVCIDRLGAPALILALHDPIVNLDASRSRRMVEMYIDAIRVLDSLPAVVGQARSSAGIGADVGRLTCADTPGQRA